MAFIVWPLWIVWTGLWLVDCKNVENCSALLSAMLPEKEAGCRFSTTCQDYILPHVHGIVFTRDQFVAVAGQCSAEIIHYGLSLSRKSVVGFTDRPDMTIDVYRGRKTTIEQEISAQEH